MSTVVFHLAFPIHDVAETKRFYVEGLGCTLGRETATAVTLGLAGHQLVAHVVDGPVARQSGIYPRHFGLIFTDRSAWEAIRDRAHRAGLTFFQQTRSRFEGTRLEHATFFLEDPAHNLLEFKHYVYDSAILGEQDQAQIGDRASSPG